MSDESERPNGEVEQTFEPEQKNGVYLLTIQRAYHGYVVLSDNGELVVESVTINGNYLGIDERIEVECEGFEIGDGEINLKYGGSGSDD